MNGVFRGSRMPMESMPTLDGRHLGDKTSLLAGIGLALNFPEYYGGNWDALDECLADLSWHTGPLRLLITDANAIPDDLQDSLIEIFLAASRQWAAEGRDFALYLVNGR
jgi:RNAse (barnase) inhibitor barstar